MGFLHERGTQHNGTTEGFYSKGTLLCSDRRRNPAGIENLLSGLPKMFDRDVIPALESFFSWMEQMAETIDPEMGAAFSGMTDILFSHLSNGVLQLCGTLLGIKE